VHPRIYEYIEEILGRHAVTGNVLEVGAVPTKDSLLFSQRLDAAAKRIGINLDGGQSMTAIAPELCRPGVEILSGDANQMPLFRDGEFQVVLNSSTAEHDKFFWKTIREMRRVLAVGGLMIISVPGFVREIAFPETPLVTYTHRVHDWPGDYYRFSEQACREVFFAGFEILEQKIILTGRVPYIVTSGKKLA